MLEIFFGQSFWPKPLKAIHTGWGTTECINRHIEIVMQFCKFDLMCTLYMYVCMYVCT